MKCVVVLHVICVVTLCRCGESLDNVQVLDISNVDGSKVTIDEGTEDGVSYKSFVPKANKDLKMVLNGGKVLWKASSEKEKCTLVEVYNGAAYTLIKLSIRTGLKSVYKCFKEVSIEEDDFDGLLEGMKNSSKDEQAEGRVVGVIEYASFPALIEESSETLYPPGDNVKVQTVNSENSEDPQAHSGHVEPTMDANRRLPLEALPGTSSSIERMVETIVKNILTKDVHKPQGPTRGTVQFPLNDKGVVLDISSPDSTKVSVTSRTSEGVKSTLFYPEGHVSIVCIMDSGMPILAEAGTICTEVYLFSKPGFPLLLKVHTKAGGSHACTYFEKGANGWTKIEKDDFDSKLGTMKNGMVRNVDVQNAFPAMEQYDNNVSTAHNVERVSNTHIGMPLLQAPGPTPYVNVPMGHPQGVYSGSYPVGPPMGYLPPVGTFMGPWPVLPLMTPIPPVQDIPQLVHIPQLQTMPPVQTPFPMHNGPYAQPIPQVALHPTQAIPQVPTPTMQLTTHMHALPHMDIFVGPEPTLQVENMMAPLPVIPTAPPMDAVPPMPTPPMDIPSTVEPKVTYNTLRNEVQSRVLEGPGEMMMARPVKTNKKKLREETAPEAKTVDLTQGEKKTKLIPETLPTPLVHTVDDVHCDAKGSHELIGHVEDSNTADLELSGDGHHSVATQLVPLTIPQLNNWLNERIPDLEVLKRDSVKLDVGSVDGVVGLTIVDSFDEDVPIKILTPKDDYRLTEIRDATTEIWKAENEKEQGMMVLLYYDTTEKPILATVTYANDNGNTVSRCYMKQDETWTVVEKNVHDDKLAGMKKGFSLSRLNVKLDVVDVDYSTFTVQDSADDILTKTFTPKTGHLITEVSEGSSTIWKGEKDEYCLFTLAYYDAAERPILATLYFVKADRTTVSRCYMKQDDRWRWTKKTVYDATLAEMKKDVILSKQNVKLDVADVDKDLFTIKESSDGGIPLKKLSPKDGYRLTEVSEKDLSIWNAYGKREHCLSTWIHYYLKFPVLVTVQFSKGDDKNDFRYYVRQADGKWKWVEKVDYDTALAKMKSLTPVLKHNVKLDLDDIYASLFTLTDSTEEGVPLKKLYPKDDYRLTEVKDGQETIWEATNYTEFGNSVWLYYEGSSPLLAAVRLVKSDGTNVLQYYDKKRGKWTQVTKDDHETALTSMKKGFSLSRLNVKLDLSAVDTNAFTVIDSREDDDILTKTFTPEKTYRLTEVSDGEEAIWQAYSSKQYCLSMFVYYDGEKPALATVTYAKDDGKTASRCYVKQDDGRWEWVNKNVHDEKLAGMKKAASLAKVKDKLDLTNIYGTLFDIKYFFDGEVPIRHITPRTGHTITEVSNGQEAIWKIETDNEHCKSAWVYYDVNTPLLVTVQFVKEDGTNVLRCYVKGEDKWNWAKKDDFDNALAKMRRDASLAKEKARLDISSIDKSLFAIAESKEGNVSIRTFTPNKNYRVTEVTDGEEAIWKAYASKEHCKSVWLHCVEEKPLLATIRYAKNDGRTPWRYYVKKDDGTWAWVNKSVHDERLDELKKEPVGPREPYTTPTKEHSPEHTLDIAKTNPSNTDIKNGLTYVTFIPKDDTVITYVVDNGREVWKASGNEKCTSIGLMSKEDSHILMLAVKEGNDLEFKCFKKGTNGEWKRINLEVYYEMLNEMSITSILDLKEPDPSTFKSLDVDVDGIPAKVFLIHPTTNISTIKNGESEVWKAPSGEACTYCIAFLRDNEPFMVALGIKGTSGQTIGHFKFKDGEWEKSTDNNIHNDLRVSNAPITKFSLNLSGKGTDSSKMFIDKNGITKLYYTAKNGHVIEKVMDDDKEIWSVSDHQVCYLAEVYSRDSAALLKLHVRDSSGIISFVRFNKEDDGTWKRITKVDFNEKLNEMKITSILDLKEPDPSTLNLLDIDVDGIPAKLFLIHPNVKTADVRNNGKVVWKAGTGEKCTYCIAFLRDNNPEVVAVGITKDSGTDEKCSRPLKFAKAGGRNIGICLQGPSSRYVEYFKYENGKWKKCQNYSDNINIIKVATDPPTKFTLDISQPDISKVNLTKYGKGSTFTTYYSPKPGYVIEKVMDGGVEVWKPTNEVCYLFEVHSKGNSRQMIVHIRHATGMHLIFLL